MGKVGFSLEKIPIIGQDLLTTLIAQISTLPILLFTFGSVSVVSIVVNVLVLWTVPILMVLGFVFAITFFIPLVSHSLLLACLPLLVYFQMIITPFNQPQFLLHIEHVPLFFVIGYYCLLFAVYFSRQRKGNSQGEVQA
jgi:competence protein ComEC